LGVVGLKLVLSVRVDAELSARGQIGTRAEVMPNTIGLLPVQKVITGML